MKSLTFHIYTLVVDVKKELQARVEERKLKLEVEKKDVPKVKADKERVHQIFENIIGNAIKFTPEGEEIKVSFEKANSHVQVNVTDTGPGISQEDQKRLFKKFGRLENSFVSMAESGGTGLGLFISKQIIDMHNGKIWVKSELGRGSSFSFTLLVAK